MTSRNEQIIYDRSFNNESDFTNFSIYDNIKLKNKNSILINASTTDVKIKICESKIINTIKGMSTEGINLTGKKLIINGVLEGNLIIKCNNRKKIKVDIIKINIPFSTHIIRNTENHINEKIKLNCTIEDISTHIITNNCILVSAFVFIRAINN